MVFQKPFVCDQGVDAMAVEREEREVPGSVWWDRHCQRGSLPPQGQRSPSRTDRHPLAHYLHLPSPKDTRVCRKTCPGEERIFSIGITVLQWRISIGYQVTI